MNNSAKKAQSELLIFCRLISLSGLSVVPGSIRQNAPPAPDILCQIEGRGDLAVELVALDVDLTRTRLNNMLVASSAWDEAMKKWPNSDRLRLSLFCKDIHIGFFTDGFGGSRDQAHFMKQIQESILNIAPDFEGFLPDCSGVKVTRGVDIVNGPQITPFSSGSWKMPLILKIQEKLSEKIYETEFSLELFAYTIWDEVGAHVDSLTMIDTCVKTYLPNSKFRRVRVFDLLQQRMEFCWPFDQEN
jgi:hypothetical protein